MPDRTAIYRTDDDIRVFKQIKFLTGQPVTGIIRLLLRLFLNREITHPSLPTLREVPDAVA